MNVSTLSGHNGVPVSVIVEQFRQIQDQLELASGGQIDAVLSASGRPYLLRTAQERLLESVATERRAAQMQSSIINALPAPVALLDTFGAILAVNQAWTERVARPLSGPDSAADRTYAETFGLGLCSPAGAMERAQRGIDGVLAGEFRHYTQEYSCASKTGTEWFKLEVSLLQAGATDGAVVMHVDVTEQKMAELETRAQAAFPRYSPHPVLAFAKGGRVVYRNRAATQLLEEFGGEVLPADLYAFVEGCLSSGNGKLLQTQLGNRTLSWSFHPIPDEEIVHCYATEITEMLSMEAQMRQSQKMETVGQLAGGIAHNFNNILTIVMGHASLLANPEYSSEAVLKSAAQIAEVATRAADLVRQLLTFSRRQVMDLVSLDLCSVLESTATILRQVLSASIVVRVECSQTVPWVRADHMMLEQVLLNLAVNARDAMPEGGELSIRADLVQVSASEAQQQAGASAGEFVRLSVHDTGCGMPHEVVAKVFEPFFTTKEVGKGTGLGLATVYGIAQQHGGWISVDSEVGQGTTFQLYLHSAPAPLIVVPEVEPLETPRGVIPENAAILFVEDEALLRMIVIQILEQAGYEVIAAASGPEAIKSWHARSKDIDLLLTDMQMPGRMSGRNLAEELRRGKPELRVIFTSGFTMERVSSGGALAARESFLQKPYIPQTLLEAVGRSLQEAVAR